MSARPTPTDCRASPAPTGSRARDAGRVRRAGGQGLCRARGRRRRAQRAARPARRRRRHRHPGAARRGDRGRARPQASRPSRPASPTARSPSSPTTCPTRSRRCAGTSRRTAATPPSPSPTTGRPMRAGATSRSTRSIAAPTARCSTRSAALPISRPGACASSAMPRERIREDYLRILRFFRLTRRIRRGSARCRWARRLRARARGSHAPVGRARAPGAAAPAGRPRAGRSWSARCSTTACSPSVLAAAPRPILLERLAALETRARLAAGCRSCVSPRWQSRCPRTPTVCAIGCASPTRSTRGSPAGPAHARHRPPHRRAAARAYLYAEGAAAYRERVLIGLGPLGVATDEPRLARSASPCPSAGSRRAFRSAAPTSWRSAFRPARASASCCARWRPGGSPATSRRTRRSCVRSCNGWLRLHGYDAEK